VITDLAIDPLLLLRQSLLPGALPQYRKNIHAEWRCVGRGRTNEISHKGRECGSQSTIRAVVERQALELMVTRLIEGR
jgi:hypothetical protein